MDRLLDCYYNNNEYLKVWGVNTSTLWVEYNSITIYTSINSDYYILIINNRIKLFYKDIKLYDNTIITPLKKYKIIMLLINKYLKQEVSTNEE